MTRPSNPLRAIQQAGYKCKARSPQGFVCNRPAGRVDGVTGLVVCQDHLTRP
ncbi:hypothetical protein JNUCC0626_18115 [Lentzea sp. JNUCC 0626]|uniref:hypothetical protein n=1 Tax=Lentzea sp. JNUCC 0626 TaxID=3367513 RepID=UPI0037478ACC